MNAGQKARLLAAAPEPAGEPDEQDGARVARYTFELGVAVARAQAEGWQHAEPWCPEPGDAA